MVAPPDVFDIYRKFLLHISVIFYLNTPATYVVASTVDKLLEQGTQLLSAGKLSEALLLYNQAVDEDPKNYLTYFRRGSAYLALGNFRLSLPDLTKAVELNAGFIPAIKQRGSLYLKLGRISEAEADYNMVLGVDPSRSKLDEIDRLKNIIKDAKMLFNQGEFSSAIPLLGEIIEVVTFNTDFREMRAECYLKTGEVHRGIQEMRHAVHLVSDNRRGLLKLSELMYEAGLALRSLEEIRECLKLDQDDKPCLTHYRMIKQLSRAITQADESQEAKDYPQCIENSLKIMKLEPKNDEYQTQAKVLLCQCYAKSKSDEGIKYCEELVQRFPDNFDYHCNLGDSYINADRFEDAIKTYQTVLGKERNHRQAKEGIKRAQKLLKNSKRRDYYKILNVPKTASKKEILKSYRKLASEYHPDKYSGDSKQEAEKKFLEISAAKEVLSDETKREQYDNGVDPLDPEQHMHEGPFGHPFGGFTFSRMHPFEGGNFEFHFG